MNTSDAPLFGAIEAGGTKFICAVGGGAQQVIDKTVIPTRAPNETLQDVVDFFSRTIHEAGPLSAIGIGSFGPIDIDARSDTYGRLLGTPKPGWPGADLGKTISTALNAPIAVDTDVNCALIGEAELGAGRGYGDIVYVTVGTGIGGGVMAAGNIVYGCRHTELGHMLVPKQPDDDFEGTCPYHGDRCIEGLACGPAIFKRWGVKANDMPVDHPAWDLEARYLALLCHNLLMTTAPQRIILGGGVMKRDHLLPLVRRKLRELIRESGDFCVTRSDFSDIVVGPALSGDAGVIGAFRIAEDYLKSLN